MTAHVPLIDLTFVSFPVICKRGTLFTTDVDLHPTQNCMPRTLSRAAAAQRRELDDMLKDARAEIAALRAAASAGVAPRGGGDDQRARELKAELEMTQVSRVGGCCGGQNPLVVWNTVVLQSHKDIEFSKSSQSKAARGRNQKHESRLVLVPC